MPTPDPEFPYRRCTAEAPCKSLYRLQKILSNNGIHWNLALTESCLEDRPHAHGLCDSASFVA